MYRWLFIAVAVVWMAAMAALIRRDVWPAWTAQDAPPMDGRQLGEPGKVREEQFAILGADNEHLGRAWGEVQVRDNGSSVVSGMLFIDGVAILPPLRVETSTEFDDQGELSEFELNVYGVPNTIIHVKGERRGIYFPCEMNFGPKHLSANLEMSASRMIGDSLRPFAVLPRLHVGQAWRMQMLDPLAAVRSGKSEFKSVVAEVTGKELLTTELSGTVSCFVVEIRELRSKAWVGPDGHVLRQEVSVPGLKRLALQEEKYNKELRNEAMQKVRTVPKSEKERYERGD